MACKQLIQFPAIYRDGELLTCTQNFAVDCSNVKILGEKTEKAWDPVSFKFMVVTGFFLDYKGIEYGTIDIDTAAFFALCKTACEGGNPEIFRIHVTQFSEEFV